MRFYKLRVTTNAAAVASQFNEQFRPETIPEANDPFRVDWIAAPTEDAYLVGEKVRPSTTPCLFPRETDHKPRLYAYQTRRNRAMCSDGRCTAATSIPVITTPIKKF